MDPRIEHVVAYIRKNYQRRLTLTEIANTVNLSRWRLCHLFKLHKPITVNGASAVSGATIPNGTTTIETPDGVGATISVPGHGTLRIAPNSKLTIEIDPSGNIKVTITQGCAVLKTNKGTRGELTNAQGVVTKADASGENLIDSCPGKKVAPVAAAGGGGLFGLSKAATIALFAGIGGGTATAIALANRGAPASQSSP